MNEQTPHRHRAEEPIHTLIIRVWSVAAAGDVAPHWRARLLEAERTATGTVATAEGVDAICRALHEWLDQLADP
ncbi:hypothetical protein ACFV99_19900 [Streptomyces sp. NPDC059944]|uniref:hypothetical protein n=1 Tax=unclassified Streptomyces TaxID=2593676 RepID=UPI00363D2F5D